PGGAAVDVKTTSTLRPRNLIDTPVRLAASSGQRLIQRPFDLALNAAAHGREQQAEVEQHLDAVLAHLDTAVRAAAFDRQHIALPLTAHAELAGQARRQLVGLFAGHRAAEIVGTFNDDLGHDDS